MRDTYIDGEYIVTTESGREISREINSYPAQIPYTDPAEWLIDIGTFFDRFGASKIPTLASTDVIVQAIVKDVLSRKWIDLKRVDVASAIDILISKGISGVDSTLKNSILNTPVALDENRALRKLYFS